MFYLCFFVTYMNTSIRANNLIIKKKKIRIKNKKNKKCNALKKKTKLKFYQYFSLFPEIMVTRSNFKL